MVTSPTYRISARGQRQQQRKPQRAVACERLRTRWSFVVGIGAVFFLVGCVIGLGT